MKVEEGRNPVQLDMFARPAPALDQYLACLDAARALRETLDGCREYLQARIAAGECTPADAVVIWRGVHRQWETPFDVCAQTEGRPK